MKRNLTLALPSELVQAAKVAAVKRGLSLNEVVRRSLERFVREDEDRESLLKEIFSPKYKFRMGGRLTRAESHERKSLLRHQRPPLRA